MCRFWIAGKKKRSRRSSRVARARLHGRIDRNRAGRTLDGKPGWGEIGQLDNYANDGAYSETDRMLINGERAGVWENYIRLYSEAGRRP